MKKVLFLMALVLFSATILCAEEQQEAAPERENKKFNIGDGGIFKVMPAENNIDVMIIYGQTSDAPEKARAQLGVDKPDGRGKLSMDRFKVKLLDDSGREICWQAISYNDFRLDREKNGRPYITLAYSTPACGKKAYARVAGVSIEYR